MPERHNSYVLQLGWLGQYILQRFEWVKFYKFAVVVSMAKKQKRKKDRERVEKQNFITLVNLVRNSNKVFIEGQRTFFFCQQEEDMMKSPRNRLCNVIEIKNNEMIQLFLVERSWNQWFCRRRFSALGDSEKRRCFQRLDHNHKDRKTHWEEGR